MKKAGIMDESGPGSIRTVHKASHATMPLRDVNRCTVRPKDLIAHQGYTNPL